MRLQCNSPVSMTEQEWIVFYITTKINPNNSNNFNRNDLIKEFIADFSATETIF